MKDAAGRVLGSASAGARRIELDPAPEGNALSLDWEPSDGETSLPDFVLLRSAPPPRGAARGALVDRLANGLATPDLRATATPSHASVAFATRTRSERNGTFLFRLPADPRTLSRAFLTYSLRGRAHWSELRRSINGLPVQGPERVARDPSLQASSRQQWEEISVESLREGENVVRFDPQDPADPVGFEIHDLELLAWHDADAADSTSSEERETSLPGLLADGNTESGISLRNGRYVLPLGARGQFHEIALHLARAGNGIVELRPRGVQGIVKRLDVGRLRVGWHRLELDDSFPPTDALLVRTTARAEGDAIVSELHTTSSPLPSDEEAIRLTAPAHGECRDGAVDIRGIVSGVDPGSAVTVNGVRHENAVLADRSFAAHITAPSHGTTQEWEAVITVQATDGRTLRKSLRLQPCRTSQTARSARGLLIEDRGAPFTRWVRASQGATFTFGELKVQIPAGALPSDQQITIRPLAPSAVAPASSGVTNVSPDGRGWRFGPHNLVFRRPIQIMLPFVEGRIPRGLGRTDVTAFYFDEHTHHWTPVRRVREDNTGRVVASTDHFTDFITGTLAAPDHPEVASLDPNSISGLAAPHPASGIQTIQPPEPNSRGSAELTFPLELPPGRRGMTPSLALTYNSHIDNGLLGVGWSLSIPSIEIDTRHGVPRYNPAHPEQYQIAGEAIVEAGTYGDSTRYQRRREGSFDRILRHGDSPASYWWEVVDRSGTRSVFGRASAARLRDPDPTRKHIFRWYLEEVIDVFGNRIRYVWETVDSHLAGPGGAPGPASTKTRLQHIEYTSHVTGETEDLPASYALDFGYGSRSDAVRNARGGFLVHEDQILTSIQVRHGGQRVRGWNLKYAVGEFEKQRLYSIEHLGAEGSGILDTHTFSYFSTDHPDSTNPEQTAFHPPQTVDAPTDGDIGGNMQASVGGGISAGIGPVGCAFTVGGGGGVGGSTDHTLAALMDLDGDGLADMTSGGPIGPNAVTPGRLGAGHVFAGWSGTQSTLGLDALSAGSTLSLNAHVAANTPVGVLAGYNWHWNWNDQDRVVTDADGDGLLDVVTGPHDAAGGRHLKVFLNPRAAGGRGSFGVPGGSGAFQEDYQINGVSFTSRPRRVSADVAQRITSVFHVTEPLIRWQAIRYAELTLLGAIERLPADPSDPEGNGEGDVIAEVWLAPDPRDSIGPWDIPTLIWQRQISSSDPPCVPAENNGCDPSGLPLKAYGITLIRPGGRVYFRVRAGGANGDDARGDLVRWNPIIRETEGTVQACTVAPDDPRCRRYDGDPTQGDQYLSQAECERLVCQGLNGSTAQDFQLNDDFRVADARLSGPVLQRGASYTIDVTVRHQYSQNATVQLETLFHSLFESGSWTGWGTTTGPGMGWSPTTIPRTSSPSYYFYGFRTAFPSIAPSPTAYTWIPPHSLAPRTSINNELDRPVVRVVPPPLAEAVDPAHVQAEAILRYEQICNRPGDVGAGTCRSVLSCDPSTSSPRTCTLESRPTDLVQPTVPYDEVNVRVPIAVGPTPNTAFGDPHAMVGRYRGWSYAEWNGSVPFDENALYEANQDLYNAIDTEAVSATTRFSTTLSRPSRNLTALSPRIGRGKGSGHVEGATSSPLAGAEARDPPGAPRRAEARLGHLRAARHRAEPLLLLAEAALRERHRRVRAARSHLLA